MIFLTHSGGMIYFCGGYMIFFAEKLRAFFVERLHDFCVWRGCVTFTLTHSLRLYDLFLWRLRDFFCGELA